MLTFLANFSKVYYPPIDSDAPFAIDRYSGEIRTNFQPGFNLDYESNDKSYTFQVVAKDNEGKKSNSESVLVTVLLSNINDERPILDRSLATIDILNTQTVSS